MPSRYEDEHPADDVFRHLAQKWLNQVEHARKKKKEVFGLAAEECLNFFNGPRTWEELMGGVVRDGESDWPDPLFKISVNKVFEFVSIFGPALYYENPVRTVKPRMPVDIPPGFFPDPQLYLSLVEQEQLRVESDGIKATLLGAYLNWTPHECGLSAESRQAIDEALIKGRSCLWTELYTPPGSAVQMVCSSFDSVDHLLIDPDASSLGDAKWIARRCVHPAWQVERDYGLPPGALRHAAGVESHAKQSDIETDEEAVEERRKGESNDLVVYWKIWSKMGVGGRLPGVRPEYRPALELFGDYCYFAVCQHCDYFLNLPPHVTGDPSFAEDPDAVFARTAWPTPFWARDGWPVSCLDFHAIPDKPWPLPHIKAGMGELKALNWIISFIVGHVRNSSRDFVVIEKSAPEEIKTAILHGRDLELLETDPVSGKSIKDVVQFLQHPQMNADIWKVVDALESLFDKRVGLTELMYGTTEVQIRSAEEAALKNQTMNVRPADMAKQVESWQAEVAAKEAMCARYHLSGEDTRPVLGALGGWCWDAYVATRDIQVAARELEYQIEAGSTQKPNKDFEVKQMSEAMNVVGPLFQQYATQTGDITPLNNLLSDWAKSRDLDPQRYQLSAALPPQPLPQDEGGTGAVQQEETGNPVPQG